jgi:hypothetical protein
METLKLTFYSLKLTQAEVDKLLHDFQNPIYFLLAFENDGKDLGFGATIYVQNDKQKTSNVSVKLSRLDNSEYLVKGPFSLSTNIVTVKSIQSLLNNPDKYLTLRPFIDTNNYLSYDIDKPNDDDLTLKGQSETNEPQILSGAATTGANSVSSKPSPPIVTPPM